MIAWKNRLSRKLHGRIRSSNGYHTYIQHRADCRAQHTCTGSDEWQANLGVELSCTSGNRMVPSSMKHHCKGPGLGLRKPFFKGIDRDLLLWSLIRFGLVWFGFEFGFTLAGFSLGWLHIFLKISFKCQFTV